MKTKKTTLQPILQLLLGAALALPLASHAANGLDLDNAAHGSAEHGPAADDGDAHFGRGGPEGGRGPRAPFGPDGAGGPAGPEPHGPGPGLHAAPGPHGMPFGEPPFMHGLALNEAQQDKVFTILHAQAPYVREQGKALRKAQEALHAAGGAEKYDDAKAASLSQAAAQAMANLELQRVRTEQKLLAVLTAEQRKQLEQRKPPRFPIQ
jgi:protein CpxP